MSVARARLQSGRRALSRLSPIFLAVTATACAALFAFITFDAARSLDAAEEQVRLVARTLAAELASTPAEIASETLLRLSADLPRGMRTQFVRAEAVDAPNTMLRLAAMSPSGGDRVSVARAMPSGSGLVTVAIDRGAVLAGVWQRATLGAAGVLLLGLATFRMRPETAPAPTDPAALEALIASIPFGVACWGPTGILLACNPQYRARLAHTDASVAPGTPYVEAIKSLSAGGFMRVVAEGENNRLLELHREDGSCLVLDERPLSGGGFITLVTDVTERKRTDLLLNTIREEQRQLARRYHEEKIRAEAASRSKTSFLAHLSHDIRTPLNHIIGFADLIRYQAYGPIGDSRYLGYVENIKVSGERLLASFAAILELAELEGGQKVLRDERFGVDDLLIEAGKRFAGQAHRAGLTLTVGAPTGARIIGDRFCLSRMLGNIVENAIRFTPSGGRITLAAFAASDGVVLEISDTGIGMAEEKLASLSQPFSFGDATFTKEHQGAGLGIAIARAIAELSGGRLAIDSSPALGTTVAISLPLAPAQPVAIAAA